jgi:hypothetical protein
MRIMAISNTSQGDISKREHHNGSPFEAFLEAEFRKVSRA